MLQKCFRRAHAISTLDWGQHCYTELQPARNSRRWQIVCDCWLRIDVSHVHPAEVSTPLGEHGLTLLWGSTCSACLWLGWVHWHCSKAAQAQLPTNLRLEGHRWPVSLLQAVWDVYCNLACISLHFPHTQKSLLVVPNLWIPIFSFIILPQFRFEQVKPFALAVRPVSSQHGRQSYVHTDVGAEEKFLTSIVMVVDQFICRCI